MTELSTLPDGGLVQSADQFVISRGGSARRVSGSRFVLTDAGGNALLSGNPSMAAGGQLRSASAPLIAGDGGANTALYTGTSGLNIRNASDSATLASLSDAGALSLSGTLAVAGSIRQNGNQVWHAGNFDPAAYLPVSAGATYMLKSGGGFTGNITVAGTILASNDIKVGGGEFSVWHAGNLVNPASTAGPAAFGGTVTATSGAASFEAAGPQPYYTFVSTDRATRFGYIQHIGANADMLIRNDRGTSIILSTGDGPQLTATPGGVNIAKNLNVSSGISAAGGLTANGGLYVDPYLYIARPNADLCDVGFDAGDVLRFSRSANQWNWIVGNVSIAGMNTSVFTHGGDITCGRDMQAARNVTVGGTLFAAVDIKVGGGQFPVWHTGNFNPNSYAPRNDNVSFRDVTANRGENRGVYYFGDGSSYVFFNGSRFEFVIAGQLVAALSPTAARFRGDVFANLGDGV